MSDMAAELFEGPDIRFGPIDYETDPAIESARTRDAGFIRLYITDPARPASAAILDKQYEKLEKQRAQGGAG